MSFSELYLSFAGRINRKTYWVNGVGALFAIAFVISFIAGFLDAVNNADGALVSLSSILVALITFWPSLALNAKRWHDRDKSAWWMLLGFIPIIGWIWVFVETGFLSGTVGENRFGPDPNGDPYALSSRQGSSFVQSANQNAYHTSNHAILSRPSFIPPEPQIATAQPESTVATKLAEAKRLLDQGVLNAEEYAELKKKILQGF